MLPPVSDIIKENEQRYNEIAENYRMRAGHFRYRSQLENLQKFERIVGPPVKRILDAGCGTGRDSKYFASRGYDVYDLDASSGMLAECKETFGSSPRNLLLSDIKTLPFKESSLDGVWTNAAIVHLPHEFKRESFREFYRILKPNGALYVWVRNFLSPEQMLRLFTSQIFHFDYQDSHLVPRPKSLGEILSNSSSLSEAISGHAYLNGIHWFYPTKHSLMDLVEKTGFSVLESNNPFSSGLSVFARKDY